MGTSHGKALPLGPPFAEILGAQLVTPADLDTDRFGTFSGETPRTRSASETARAKARLGMRAARLPFGLASEASYGPLTGIALPGHEEILVFLDDVLGIEVLEGYRTVQTPGTAHRVTETADLPAPLLDGLGEQALVVRPSTGGTAADIVKGITAVGDLDAAILQAARRSPDGTALVEPDLRAHHNPSRRVVLGRLAQTLARRLATRCPACAAPGFGRAETEPGLPCRACGTPTPTARAEIHACAACPYRETRPVGTAADPGCCPLCNP